MYILQKPTFPALMTTRPRGGGRRPRLTTNVIAKTDHDDVDHAVSTTIPPKLPAAAGGGNSNDPPKPPPAGSSGDGAGDDARKKIVWDAFTFTLGAFVTGVLAFIAKENCTSVKKSLSGGKPDEKERQVAAIESIANFLQSGGGGGGGGGGGDGGGVGGGKVWSGEKAWDAIGFALSAYASGVFGFIAQENCKTLKKKIMGKEE